MIVRALDSISNIESKELSLTRGQYLYSVRAYENPGIIQEKIAELIKVNRTTTARVIERLEEQGFIYRREGANSKKIKQIYVIERGKNVYPITVHENQHSNQVALQGLSEVGISQLAKYLVRMHKNINEDWEFVKKGNTRNYQGKNGWLMGEVRQLIIEDAPASWEISIETYIDTFGPYNTPENMQVHLVEAYNLEKLQKELANPYSDFYFTFVDNQLVGYMKLNRGKTQAELMGPEKLEVGRLYILSTFKGEKLGTRLLELAEEKTREFGKKALWLGVREHNGAVWAFHKTISYRCCSQRSFFMEDDEQTDFISLKEL